MFSYCQKKNPSRIDHLLSYLPITIWPRTYYSPTTPFIEDKHFVVTNFEIHWKFILFKLHLCPSLSTLSWMNWMNAKHCQIFYYTLHCYSSTVVPIHVTSSCDYPSFNHEQILSHISHKWWLNTGMIRICNSPNDMQIHSGCLTVLMITKLNFLEAVR